MRIMKKYSYEITLICISVFLIRYLFTAGFIPTHDGEYHLIRFYEFTKMLRSGHLFPRWAPGLNSGYGMPIFNFFYPFPNYIGSLFHMLGLSLVRSFQLTLAIGYISAMLFCFTWLGILFDKKHALVGAVLSGLVPYWFVNMYVRGSIGEVLGIMWVFLFLYLTEKRSYIFSSVVFALLILTHNIAALLFAPLLLLYCFFRNRSLMPIFIGIGVSTYFWLPAFVESRYVTGLNTVTYSDHFPDIYELLVPSWGTAFSGSAGLGNKMSFQIGIMPLAVLLVGIVMVVKKRMDKKLSALFISTAVVVLLLMTKYSKLLWDIFTPLQFIQYPWRLLLYVITITGFFGAAIASRVKKAWSVVVIVLFSFLLIHKYSIPVVYEPRSDEHYLTRRNFTDGTSSLGNGFTTVWIPWIQDRATASAQIIQGSGRIVSTIIKPVQHEFTINADTEVMVRDNTTYFPGWRVYANGKEVEIDYQTNGIIQYGLPEGTHDIEVVFRNSKTRTIASSISLVSLLSLAIWSILKHRYEDRN